QQARACHVLQKLDAEPGAFGGTFDQTRDVGDDEALIRADADDAEMRLQRRERIVGDARRRRGHGAYKCGFARIREAEQTDVGEPLQFETKIAHVTRGARRRLARRAIGRALEGGIADAAASADGDLQPLAVADQVADDFLGIDVDDGRADRNTNDGVLTLLAGHLPAHPVLAALGGERALVAKGAGGVQASGGDEPDTAAVAAVAAAGPAERNEFLAPEADAAVAAVAGVDGDFGFVDEFHGRAGNRESGKSIRAPS